MNRSPRRSLRTQPPLRGRLAASPSLSNDQSTMAVVRQRPPISSGRTTIIKVMEKPIREEIHPEWVELFEKYPALFKLLNRPWKWLIVLVVLLVMSIMLGKLL